MDRQPIRESSPSWQKASADTSVSVPTEMMAWVGGTNGDAHSAGESSDHAPANAGEAADNPATVTMETAQT